MERRQREDHLAACAACATEFELFREFVEAWPRDQERADVDWIVHRLRSSAVAAGETAEAPAPSQGERPGFRFWEWMEPARWAWAGAAAAAAMAIALFINQGAAPRVPSRLGPEAMVLRSTELAAVAPIGDLSASPSVLQCEPAEGAALYRFELREVDRTLLWSGESAEPRIELPAEIRAAAVPAKTLLWSVVAVDASGAELGKTAPQRFRVAPRDLGGIER